MILVVPYASVVLLLLKGDSCLEKLTNVWNINKNSINVCSSSSTLNRNVLFFMCWTGFADVFVQESRLNKQHSMNEEGFHLFYCPFALWRTRFPILMHKSDMKLYVCPPHTLLPTTTCNPVWDNFGNDYPVAVCWTGNNKDLVELQMCFLSCLLEPVIKCEQSLVSVASARFPWQPDIFTPLLHPFHSNADTANSWATYTFFPPPLAATGATVTFSYIWTFQMCPCGFFFHANKSWVGNLPCLKPLSAFFVETIQWALNGSIFSQWI